MKLIHALACALVLAPLPAMANDTTAQLGTGGLAFVANEDIEMASEDLSISPTQVKVVYKFHNKSDQDQRVFDGDPHPVERALQQGRWWQATELKARRKRAAS